MNPTPSNSSIEKLPSHTTDNQVETSDLQEVRQLAQEVFEEHKTAEKTKDKKTLDTQHASLHQQENLEKNIQTHNSEKEAKKIQAEVERSVGTEKIQNTLSDKKNTREEKEALGENYPTNIESQVVGLIDTNPENIKDIDMVQRESLNIYTGWNLIGSLYAKLLQKHKNITDKTIDTKSFLQDLQNIDISSLDKLTTALTEYSADLNTNEKKILNFLSSSNFGKNFQEKVYPKIAATMSKNIEGFVDDYNAAVQNPEQASILDKGREATKTGVHYIRDGAKNVFNKDAWKNNPVQTAVGVAGIIGGAYVGYKALKGIFSRFAGDDEKENAADKEASSKPEKKGFWGKIFGGITKALKFGIPLAAGAYLVHNLANMGKVSEQAKELLDKAKGDVTEKAEKTKENVENKISDFLEKQRENMYNKMKQQLGKNIDKKKFDEAFNEWAKNNKPKLEKLKIENNPNLVDLGMAGVSLPFSAGFDFIMTMKKHNIISWGEISRYGAKQGTKEVFGYGLKGFQLLGSAGSLLLGETKLEEIAATVKEKGNQLSSEERMFLRASLYRNGGILRSIMGTMGNVLGECTHFLVSGQSNQLSKLQGFKAGFMSDLDKQIQIVDDLSKTLKVDGNPSELLKSMKQGIEVAKENLVISSSLKKAKTWKEFETIMKDLGHTDLYDRFFKQIESDPIGKHLIKDIDTKPIKSISGIIGNILSNNTNSAISAIQDKQGTFNNVFKNMRRSLGLNPLSYYGTHADDISQMLKNMTHTQERLLQNDKIFSRLQNAFHQTESGKQMMRMIEKGDEVRLHLTNIDDAKSFFQNIKTLSRQAPELLGTIFRNVPLIFVGKEILEQMNDPNNDKSNSKIITQGFMSLIPIVGPFMLIHDGANIDTFDRSKVGFGGALLGYDGYRLIKTLGASAGKIDALKRVAKFGLEPGIDAFKFMKGAVVDVAPMVYKNSKDLMRVVRVGGRKAFFQEAKIFGKGVGVKLSIAAGIVTAGYLGYKRYEHESDLTQEQKETMAKVEADPQGYNKQMKEQRPTFSPEEKKKIVTLAYAEQLSLDPQDISIEYNESENRYLCTFESNVLINKALLSNAQNHVQETLSIWGDETKQSMRPSRNSAETMIQNLKEQQGDDNQETMSDEETFEYLQSIGYSPEDIENFFYIRIKKETVKVPETTATNTPEKSETNIENQNESSIGTETFVLMRAHELGLMNSNDKMHSLHKRWEEKGERMLIQEKQDLKKLATQQKLSDHPMLHDITSKLTQIDKGIKDGTITSFADIDKKFGKDFLQEYKKVYEGLKKGKRADVLAIATEKGKKTIEQGEIKIEEIKKIAKEKLAEYDTKLSKETDPKKLSSLKSEYQKQVQELLKKYNQEIYTIEKNIVGGMAYMEHTHLSSLKSPTVEHILKLNNGVDNFIQHTRPGKFLHAGTRGIMVVSMALSLFNAGQTGGAKEVGLTLADMGLGLIPFAGGVYDLGVAIAGKDIAGHDLSTKDRIVRAGFGIVGLIPGVGTVVKLAKTGTKVASSAKTMRAVNTAIHAAQAARVAGKIGTYGYLGYELTSLAIEYIPKAGGITHYISNEIQDKIDNSSLN